MMKATSMIASIAARTFSARRQHHAPSTWSGFNAAPPLRTASTEGSRALSRRQGSHGSHRRAFVSPIAYGAHPSKCGDLVDHALRPVLGKVGPLVLLARI